MNQLSTVKALLQSRGIAFGEHSTDDSTTITVSGAAFGRISRADKLQLTDLARDLHVSAELAEVQEDPQFIHITDKNNPV